MMLATMQKSRMSSTVELPNAAADNLGHGFVYGQPKGNKPQQRRPDDVEKEPPVQYGEKDADDGHAFGSQSFRGYRQSEDEHDGKHDAQMQI